MVPWVVSGVFLVTFLVVFAVAYTVFAKKPSSPTPSVPKAVASVPKAVASAPRPAGAVSVYVWVYRGLMLITGLVGLVATAFMYLEARFIGVQAIPGSIVFLLSLLALWNAWKPSAEVMEIGKRK